MSNSNLTIFLFALDVNKLILTKRIDLIPKWQKIHYSFVSLLIGLVASIPSTEFKGIFGLKRGNKGQLTWRQKNNVFSTILELGVWPAQIFFTSQICITPNQIPCVI